MSVPIHDDGRTGPRTSIHERGSALVIAVLIVVIMTLLGLAFMLTGETESKIARNQRDAAQAGFVAEGAVRMVKKWFDAPSGPRAHVVPTVAQMDRTQRWVDDDGDGTYEDYSTASAPFNVVYRQDTDDPFEKPYRGSPKFALLGTIEHPDIRISETGSSSQQAFLATMNAALYPDFPASSQSVRVRQIDVYAPPILMVGGQRTRYGIATVRVTADVYQYPGTVHETRIATRIVSAVLNEAPFSNFAGPLQSCVNMSYSGDFNPHWGMVTADGFMDLNNNLDQKVDSSVPFTSDRSRIISIDMDGDGTRDTATPGVQTVGDRNADGTLDFDNWIQAAGGVDDPWLKFWSMGDVLSGGHAIIPPGTPLPPPCVTPGPECQPDPWWQQGYNAPAATITFPAPQDDHSNIFKNVAQELCPVYDYKFWKEVVQSGCENCMYYKSDGPGLNPSTWQLNGDPSQPHVTFQQAVDGKNGFFFFDTDTNSEPVDSNLDGTFENVTAYVDLSGQGVATGGFIYLNANVRTTGSGSVPSSANRDLIAPGEPFLDANGNNKYDPEEWFVDLTYPATRNGSYVKNGMYRDIDNIPGHLHQDPSIDTGSDGKYSVGINVYGIFYIQGWFDAQGNWIFFGGVIAKSGMTPSNAGTPEFYFDERIIKDQWPPFELGLVRTVITAWQTDL